MAWSSHFQSGQMRECQHDLDFRERWIDRSDIHCAYEDLPKADQEWIVNGDLRPDLTADAVWESGGWVWDPGVF